MRVKRIGAVAMADTLSSHSIIREWIASTRWYPVFDSARQPTLFAFLILLERCMCARVCSSWKEFALQAFSRFFADYNQKYCAFFNQGNAVFVSIIMCSVLV